MGTGLQRQGIDKGKDGYRVERVCQLDRRWAATLRGQRGGCIPTPECGRLLRRRQVGWRREEVFVVAGEEYFYHDAISKSGIRRRMERASYARLASSQLGIRG